MTGPAFDIRPGCEADIEALLDIECRAATLLAGHRVYAVFAMHTLSASDLLTGIERGILRVAEVGGRAAGFALCGQVDAKAHLFEIDVLPEHGRRGIGSGLLEAVCSEAAARGYAAMTLTTLRDVAWNAPFYARHGFVELKETLWGEQLQRIVRNERMLGFPKELRLVMQRELVTGQAARSV